MMSLLISEVIILLIFIIMSIEDLKRLEISGKFMLLLLLIAVFKATLMRIVIAIIFYIVALFTVNFFEDKIGGGDISLLLILFLMYGKAVWLILFVASFSGLLFSLISHRKCIAFVPFLTLGLIITDGVRYVAI